MDAPIRCGLCRFVFHPMMYKQYFDALKRGEDSEAALLCVQDRNSDCYGCNVVILAYMPRMEDEFHTGPKPQPVAFRQPLGDFLPLCKPELPDILV